MLRSFFSLLSGFWAFDLHLEVGRIPEAILFVCLKEPVCRSSASSHLDSLFSALLLCPSFLSPHTIEEECVSRLCFLPMY